MKNIIISTIVIAATILSIVGGLTVYDSVVKLQAAQASAFERTMSGQ